MESKCLKNSHLKLIHFETVTWHTRQPFHLTIYFYTNISVNPGARLNKQTSSTQGGNAMCNTRASTSVRPVRQSIFIDHICFDVNKRSLCMMFSRKVYIFLIKY